MPVTTEDPFASAPAADEAQAAPATEPAADPAPAQLVTPAALAAVATNDLERVRITLKSGSAYDVPWITADFPSIDAAYDTLVDGERQKKLATIFEIAGRANAKFVELVTGSKAAPVNVSSGQTQPASTPPAGAQSAPDGTTRSCKHGEMQFRSGFSAKTNKAWSAFMCPTPKGTPDQCSAEWI